MGMGARRGYNLLVAALVALLVPACGGGGEGQDYYVSVRQFENGTKGFYFMGTPEMELARSGYIHGQQYGLKEGFLKLMNDNFKKAGVTNGVNGNEIIPDEIDESGGTLVQGVAKFAGGAAQTNSDIAYYVQGGKEGYGYAYVTFKTADGTAPSLIAGFLGCQTPDKLINVANNWHLNWSVSELDQVLLLSLSGCMLNIQLDFSAGIATVILSYTTASTVTSGGGGDSDDGSSGSIPEGDIEETSEKPTVMVKRPFVAIDL